MQYQIFNVPIPDSTKETDALNTFINGVKVVSCTKELVHIEKSAFWSFVVEYYKEVNINKENATTSKIDYREVLSEEDFAIFAKLRDLRKKLAEASGVPVFAVYTNEQLAQMVQKKCNSKTSLMSINGIGDKKIEQYGTQTLEFLKTVFLPKKDETLF